MMPLRRVSLSLNILNILRRNIKYRYHDQSVFYRIRIHVNCYIVYVSICVFAAMISCKLIFKKQVKSYSCVFRIELLAYLSF